MTKRIFRSVLASTLVVLAMSVALITIVLNNQFIKMEKRQLAVQTELAAAGVNSEGQAYLDALQPDGYRVTWIATDGSVLYDSEVDASAMENHREREEFKQALANGVGSAERESDTVATKTMYYAMRLDDSSVIRVAVTRSTVGLMLVRMISALIWIVIAAIAASILIARSLSRQIVEPLNHLDLDHPLDHRQYDEIAPLLVRIDRQNHQINDQMNELHQKKKEFETVTGSIREGLILLNKDREILSMNPAAYTIFSAPKESEGKDILTICRDEEFSELVNSALKHEQAETIIEMNHRQIRVDASPITSHGILTGVSILAWDISDEYAAEQQRREFTANVSHELKTPLHSIMGSAELLEDHLVKPQDQDAFLHKIRTESSRLLSLIDDIIQLSQLDDIKQVDETKVNLKDLVSEAGEALEQSADEHHVKMTLNLDNAEVMANDRLMYEIVYNLMDNAIRYNKDPGTITVTTKVDKGKPTVIVSDTGIGIPKESQSRVFERFYRVDKSHSRKTGGTGLGLSIVKHAVQLCHGTITLDSKVGEGSTFTVRFNQTA